jgi:hypothetical protein
MNQDLETWLETARKNLAPRAKEIVREQITEHFAAALDQYLLEGKSLLEAQALALADLGSASVAAKKFEQAYLTNKQLKSLIAAKESSGRNVLPILAVSVVMFSDWYRVFFVKFHDPSGLYFLSPWFSTLLFLLMVVQKIAANNFSLRNFVLLETVLTGLSVCLMTVLSYVNKDFFLGSHYNFVIVLLILAGIYTIFTRVPSWRKLSSL